MKVNNMDLEIGGQVITISVDKLDVIKIRSLSRPVLMVYQWKTRSPQELLHICHEFIKSVLDMKDEGIITFPQAVQLNNLLHTCFVR